MSQTRRFACNGCGSCDKSPRSTNSTCGWRAVILNRARPTRCWFGQAAAQIAAMCGARVFGVTRRAEAFAQPHCPVRMIDASSADLVAVVREETVGHGADVIYNTVGSPYFAVASQLLAHGGQQIL